MRECYAITDDRIDTWKITIYLEKEVVHYCSKNRTESEKNYGIKERKENLC